MPITILEKMPKGINPIDEFEIALDGRRLNDVVNDSVGKRGYDDFPVYTSVGQNPGRIYTDEPNVVLVRIYPKDMGAL